MATNLFSPYKSHPLNRAKSPTRVTSMAKLIANEDTQWIYGDFEIGYDPCTSCFSSALDVLITPIASGDISLTGRSLANSVPVRDSNGMVSDDYLTSYLLETGVDQQVGATTFRNYQALHDMFKNQEDIAHAIYSGGNGWSPNSDAAFALNKVSEFLGGAGGVSPEPISKTVLNGLSSLTKFANFSRPSVLTGLQLPPPMPTVVFGELSLRGSVEFMGNTDKITIEMPGSLGAKEAPELSPNGSYPTYNEELGIFSLITMPTLSLSNPNQRMAIRDNGYLCVTFSSKCQLSGVGLSMTVEYPFEWDFRSSNWNWKASNVYKGSIGELLYTINPASGWSPEDIEVFVAAERVTQGLDGVWRSYTSTFVPIEKWKEELWMALSPEPWPYEEQARFNLKVAVTKAGTMDIERSSLFIEPSSKTQLMQLLTYPIKMTRTGTRLTDSTDKYSVLERPYAMRPYYVSPQSYEEHFCKDESEYLVKNSPLQ
ncbi:hypothetical protein [Vibrio coralliilyticus]|uniref:hypothetical protein n=1 Tax=Vibrio coralliilyticus TaxID=190893 RepID=UPI00210A66DF|nr:hypothetical protein [Vibrio coralliilyticus]